MFQSSDSSSVLVKTTVSNISISKHFRYFRSLGVLLDHQVHTPVNISTINDDRARLYLLKCIAYRGNNLHVVPEDTYIDKNCLYI